MDIYIYGSICRGEIDSHSDIDILCIVENESNKSVLDLPSYYSIYSKKRILNHFNLGTLFAWHLFNDAILVHSKSNGFLSEIGKPNLYNNSKEDFTILESILNTSINNIKKQQINIVYELGLVYVAIRNIATIASWYTPYGLNCSRYVPYKLELVTFPLEKSIYNVFVNCRHATTRGLEVIFDDNFNNAINSLDSISNWANQIIQNKYI